eukprot:2239175-Rhodomonas_salina.1
MSKDLCTLLYSLPSPPPEQLHVRGAATRDQAAALRLWADRRCCTLYLVVTISGTTQVVLSESAELCSSGSHPLLRSPCGAGRCLRPFHCTPQPMDPRVLLPHPHNPCISPPRLSIHLVLALFLRDPVPFVLCGVAAAQSPCRHASGAAQPWRAGHSG